MKYVLIYLFFCIFSNARSFDSLSNLEKSSAKKALKKYNLELSDSYKNKKIGKIYVYVEDPFTDKQWLKFTNIVHINTKEKFILKDIFIKNGDIYDEEKIFDSEQALNTSTKVFAFILPVKNNSTNSENIDLLVVTKDRISIYANCGFNGSSWSFNSFNLSLGETNFLGLNQKLIINYNLDTMNHDIDLSYFIPLLNGWQIQARPGIYIGKDKEHHLGYYADASISYPLRSFSDKWGGLFSLKTYKKLLMDIRDNNIVKVKVLDKSVEKKYLYENIFSEVKVERSFGYLQKNELYFGHKINYQKSHMIKSLGLNKAEKEYFRNNYIIKNELESFIFIGTKYFENRFLTFYNYDTFALQETKRLGFNLDIGLDLASKIIASDNSFVRPNVSISHTFALANDGFIELDAFASSRLKSFDNTRYNGTILTIMPLLFKTIRPVARIYYTESIKNKDNLLYSLGSNSYLRGVKPRFFTGSKIFSTNFELRSIALDFKILQTGIVSFYDTGLAFSDWKKFTPTHSIGLGLRFLVPQLSTQVVSVDFAYPIYSSAPHKDRVVVSFNVGQKF